MLVAENVMKFDAIEPTQGIFNFTKADTLMDYAEANNMKVRGHALLWHSQVPNWVSALPYSEREAALQNHIDKILTRYRGKIHSWDVVNEVIKNDGSGLRNDNETPGTSDYSVWADTPTDDSLIKEAFYRANAVDPNARLFINDYSIEVMGTSKADALYNKIAGWVSQGVPIDGVGFQSHFLQSPAPNITGIRNNIQRYVALGLEVQFTEVDIRINTPADASELASQAEIYGDLIQIVLDYSNVDTFLVWGVTDKYSWIPDFFSGQGAALLFDEAYAPKPAYNTLKNKLQ